MIKRRTVSILTLSILSLSLFFGCSSKESEEIQIPIYESKGVTIPTVKVKKEDLSVTATVPGNIGYVMADTVYSPYSSNLVEFNARKNKQFKKGEVIAVLDSSSMDYDVRMQEVLTQAAYEAYQLSKSEHDRLSYEIKKAELDLIRFKQDSYTIRAPYDCIIVSAEAKKNGDFIDEGDTLFTLSKPEDVMIFLHSDFEKFAVGRSLTVRINNNDYTAKVAMVDTKTQSYSVRRKDPATGVVLITLDEGELEKLLTDTPNALEAGWATLFVQTVDKRDVLTVPSSAVKTFSGASYCSLVQNNTKIQIPVEIGDTISGSVVLISGLTEGDAIALN